MFLKKCYHRLPEVIIQLLSLFFFLMVIMPYSVRGQSDTLNRFTKPISLDSAFTGETDESVTTCTNSNFSLGSFSGWTGCYGLWCDVNPGSTRCSGPSAYVPYNPPCNPPGTNWTNIPSGGHFGIESPGFDPCIAALNKVFPGETHSALLGNRMCGSGGGGYADQLTYPIVYDPANSFFIYRCAVILSDITDPTHNTPDKRPRFTFEIKDHLTGTVIDPLCGFYDLWPGDGITVWNDGPNDYVWKDWSTIGIDLSGFSGLTPGQILDATFTVHGCSFTAHTGYAYISTTCGSMNIAIAGCEGTGTVVMTAPPGFVEYEWRGPGLTGPVVGNGQTCTIIGAVTGQVYYLNLTALNGCEVTNVAQTISFTSVSPAFTQTINCVGNSSSFNDISTSSNPDQPITRRTWDFGDGTPIVGPTTANPVTHTYSAAGTYTVVLVSYSQDDCEGTTSHSVTVGPPPTITNLTAGKEICSGDNVAINMEFSQTGADATWIYSTTTGTATVTKDPPTQSGTLINDLIVNTGTADAVVTYTITPRVGSCIATPVPYLVTIHLLPDPTITGPASVCSGQTGVAYTTEASKTGYTWAVSAGGTIASGSGTEAITVDWGGSGAQTVSVNYTDANNCDAAAPTVKNITVNPLPTATITGTTGVCLGDPAPLLTFTGATGTAPYTFTYTINSGTPQTISTTVGNSVTVSQTTVAAGTFEYSLLSVADDKTCTQLQAGAATITVNPIPDVTAIANQVVCHNTATTDVTFTGSVPGTVYTWSNNNTSIGLADVGIGDIPTFTATNNSSTPVTATITIIPSYTNAGITCTGSSSTFTITVNPAGQVNDPLDQVVCNSASTSVTFVTINTGGTTTYSWANNTTSIGLAGSGIGDIASFAAINSGTSPVTATITVTPTFTNGAVSCAGPDQIFTITVNPSGQVNDPADQVVCHNSSTSATFGTTYTGGTTTFSWINNTTSIGLAGSGTGDIASFTATNPGSAPVTATITVTPTFTNGLVSCVGPDQTFTITVNPAGQVNDPANQVVCNAATTSAVFSTTNTGGTNTYAWLNNTPSIGLAASGTGDISSFTATNAGTSPVTATITVIPTFTNTLVSCTGPEQTFTITVNPTGQMNDPSDQVVCNGASTSVTFVTINTGGTTTYSWANNTPSIGLSNSGTGDIASFSAINTGTSPITATITVTPTFTNGAVSCAGPDQIFTITVNPSGQVNDPVDQVVCHNSSTSATFGTTHTGGTTTYSWTNNTTSIGLAGSGTGDIASFTATNSGSTPVTATITVTPTFTNGLVSCVGPDQTFTITVNPAGQVNDPADQMVCNAATTSASFSTTNTGGTTTYAWLNNTPSIGLAASGTGDISSFTTTNTGTSPVTATITVTPTFTNTLVSCAGPEQTFTITVNPTGQVNDPSDQVVCNGASTSVTFVTINTGGTTTYSWANNTPSIGLANSGTGDIASFAAINTGTSPVTAAITVTPTFTNGAVSCAGPDQIFTITVNPSGQVNDPADQVVCHNSSTSVTFGTTHTGGTITYSWINNTTSIGLAGSGTGNIASFTATNSGSAPVTATITVTPTFTNGMVSCVGPDQTFTITVNPIPTVNAVANQVVCNAANTTTVNFSGFVPGTVYNWINNNTSIGLPDNGSSDIPSFVATNGTFAPVTATIIVTPVFSNAGTTCTGSSTSFTITVNPKPNVIFPATPPNPQEVCSGSTSLPVTLSSSVITPGVTYSWSAAAFDPVNPTTSITGFTTPNNGTSIPGENIVSFLLTQGVIKYTVTAAFNTPGLVCPGDPMEYQTLVNPSPTVALTPSDPIGQAICSGQTSLPVTFVPNVTPTIYSWQAVETVGVTGAIPGGTTDNIPAHQLTLTGPTQGHVKYKVTPSYQGGGSFTCPGGVSYSTIFVNPLPAPTITGPALTCELGPEATYSTPGLPGHSYLWSITGGAITSAANISQITVQWGPSSGSPGTLTVSETIDATACQVTSPVYQVTLQQRPIPTLSGPTTVCTGAVNQFYSTESSMFQYNWQISGGTITSGGTAGSSTATVTWTNPGTGNWIEVNYQNALGCPGFPAKRIDVMINPLPVTTITPGAGPDCNLQSHIYETPLNLACTYTWSATPGNVVAGQGTNSASISWLAAGPATIAVTGTYAGTTGCTSSSTYNTTVYPSPAPTFNACFDVVTTQNAKPLLLKGGLPLNGVYQGSPAIAFDNLTGKYWFNPASALIMPGMHPVTYFSQNSYGCANSSTPVSITVLPSNATFACNTVFTDPRDGKQYQTAMLGTQCWMKENLRYSAPSPYVSTAFSTPQTDNCTFERYCLPADASCTSFGALYQWNELMQYNDELGATRQGLCPPGWHVPSATEWQNMIDASQGNGIAGGELKDLVTAQAFHALLGGIGYLNNMWAFTNTDNPNASLYWTSSLTGNKPIARGLNAINPSVSIYESSSANAFPVRCVKD